jgi:putative colanic acid biosynthesis UDP-glucose lipid carrier transferase
VIYKQPRAGLQNQLFFIYKFRSMHLGNDDENRQASAADTRIFPAGRWFRRTSLDEIPQFLNVFRGEMSLVGPRPHLVQHNEQFARHMKSYYVRAMVKPGITGLAQVRGFRGEARSEQDIVKRIESDISYLETWSFSLDLVILARTAWQVLFPPKTAL